MPPEEMPLGYPRRALPFEKRFVSLGAVSGSVQAKLSMQRETDCRTSDIGHWLAMTYRKLASATRGRLIIVPTGARCAHRPAERGILAVQKVLPTNHCPLSTDHFLVRNRITPLAKCQAGKINPPVPLQCPEFSVIIE